MPDAIVIGGGLFGSIIARALRNQGREVLMIDNRQPLAGSGPAACLMKPSWFSSMGREVYEPALRLLDEQYGVRDVEFQLRPKLGRATVHWIPPGEILGEVFLMDEVKSIDPGIVRGHYGYYKAPLIVVAAGIWTERLLPQYKQVGQQGVAFLWKDSTIAPPFIKPWAPYRQMVAFNRGDGLWASDGTAIKRENWVDSREDMSYSRVAVEIGRLGHGDRLAGLAEPLLGIRPYAKGHKPCLLEEVSPGLWVASGGAKNGTLAAGYCAHVIRERTS